MKWYAHHPADYMKHTDHLSMLEDSAYRRLLDSYYAKEKPLSSNRKHLLSICRAFASEEQCAVDSVIEQFFYIDGNFYRNERADEEIEKARNLRKKRKSSGKKGGLAKAKASAKQKPQQTGEQLPPHTCAGGERVITLNPVKDAELVITCNDDFSKVRIEDVALVLKNNLHGGSYKENLEAFLMDAANTTTSIKNTTGMLRSYMSGYGKKQSGVKKEVRGL